MAILGGEIGVFWQVFASKIIMLSQIFHQNFSAYFWSLETQVYYQSDWLTDCGRDCIFDMFVFGNISSSTE